MNLTTYAHAISRVIPNVIYFLFFSINGRNPGIYNGNFVEQSVFQYRKTSLFKDYELRISEESRSYTKEAFE